MPKKAIDILKSFFETGDRPTQSQFADLIDSFHHKDGAALITEKTYDAQTGEVNLVFTDNSSLNFTIPTSFTIAEIDGLIDALNDKVDKVAGKGLSSNDFTNTLLNELQAATAHVSDDTLHVSAQDRLDWDNKVDKEDGKGLSTNDYDDAEAQKVADAVAHAQDDGRHLTPEAIENFNQNLRAYEVGEEFFDTSLNVHRVFEDEIYKFDEDTATFPFVSTNFATELAAGAWVRVLENAKSISPYNMVLKGLGAQMPTLLSLAQNSNRVTNRVADGSMIAGTNYIDEYVSSFTVIGGDVYLSILKPILINFNATTHSDLTHLIDLDGNIIFGLNLSNYPNLKEIHLPEIPSLSIGGNPELYYAHTPKITQISGGSNLPKFKFENFKQPLLTYAPNFKPSGTTPQPSVMPLNYLPNMAFIEQQDFFTGLSFTVANLPSMTELRGNFCRFAPLTEFNAPKVVKIGTQCFWSANSIKKLDFPECLYVGIDNGVNTFSMNGIEEINIPKCIQIGPDTDANNNNFNNIKVGCIINVNDVLRTSNNGEPDPDLVYARDVRGCIINYIDNKPMPANNFTGWAQYGDDQYTDVSPLTIAQGATETIDLNGAANTVKSQMPIDAVNGELYDVATSKITPILSGDGYAISIGFKGSSNSNNGSATIGVDIGGAFGQIFKRNFRFLRGTNVVHDFYLTSQGYSLGTFITNGGIIKVTSDTGLTEIHDITVQIHRTHKAR